MLGPESASLPVDDAAFVQEAQAADQLGGVEPGQFGAEPTHLAQVEAQVSAVQKLQHEKQLRLDK